jgi:CheY-like chemotaxis protein
MSVAPFNLPRPLNVLVVDDSKGTRKMIARILRLKNICPNAEEAVDGQQSVNIVSKNLLSFEECKENSGLCPFDLILMDFVMPVMDGPTATRRIRDLGFKGLIIGVTGNVLEEDRKHFMKQGADAVLSKPLDFDQLYALLSVSPQIINECVQKRVTRGTAIATAVVSVVDAEAPDEQQGLSSVSSFSVEHFFLDEKTGEAERLYSTALASEISPGFSLSSPHNRPPLISGNGEGHANTTEGDLSAARRRGALRRGNVLPTTTAGTRDFRPLDKDYASILSMTTAEAMLGSPPNVELMQPAAVPQASLLSLSTSAAGAVEHHQQEHDRDSVVELAINAINSSQYDRPAIVSRNWPIAPQRSTRSRDLSAVNRRDQAADVPVLREQIVREIAALEVANADSSAVSAGEISVDRSSARLLRSLSSSFNLLWSRSGSGGSRGGFSRSNRVLGSTSGGVPLATIDFRGELCEEAGNDRRRQSIATTSTANSYCCGCLLSVTMFRSRRRVSLSPRSGKGPIA